MKPITFTLILVLFQLMRTAHSQRRCPRGSATVNGTCVTCPAGTMSENREECVPCPPGTAIHFDGATFCLLCPIGRFSSQFGMARCEHCPRNSAALNRGSAECTSSCRSGCPKCAPGFGYDARRNRCRKCRRGTISSVYSATACFPCARGSVANADRTRCVCPPGLLEGNMYASGSCRQCAPGGRSPNGFRCVCDAGRITIASSLSSRGFVDECRCPVGMKDVNGSCVQCTARDLQGLECETCSPGYGEVNGRCRRCRGNTFSRTEGVEPCEECPEGMMANRFGDDCFCPRGMGLNDDGACEVCPPGTSSNRFTGFCNR